MTEKNKAIFNYLDDYIQGDISDFSVFINGQWGCGKTYFIREWITHVTTNYNLKNFNIDIKPLYISLYGLKSTGDIANAIRKALHPVWNSNTVNKIKKAALQIGSIALKYDLSGATLSDKSEVTVNLDLLDLLADNGSDTKLKGRRILIFDDFERCSIPKNNLLGYINNFIEHSSCYVIIIGDDTKFGPIEYKSFETIKEKTIGREFLLEADINSAIDCFIQQVGSTYLNLLNENKSLIVDLFRASGVENLRILKHAIYDYSSCLSKLSSKDIIRRPSYSNVARNLLSNFIMCYLELLSSDTVEKNEFELDLEGAEKIDLGIRKDDIQDNEDRKKYLAGRRDLYKDVNITHNISVPELEYCDMILTYLYEGFFDVNAIVAEVNVVVEHPIQYLCNVYQVTDEGFKKYYPQVKEDYLSNRYVRAMDIFDGGVALLYYSENGLDKLSYDEIACHALKMFQTERLSQSDLHNLDVAFSQRNFYFSGIGIKRRLDDFTNVLRAKIVKTQKTCKDDLTVYWESLTNDNVGDIERMLGMSTPDRSTSYDNTSIFSKVDIDHFVKRILDLNNQSLRIFYASMVKHYNMFLRISNTDEFVQYYADDISPLKKISIKLNNGIHKEQPIKGLQIKMISGKFLEYSKKIEEINESTLRKSK